jgi:DNA-binding NtrC family response regulator
VLQARDVKEALEQHGSSLAKTDLVIMDGDAADMIESEGFDRFKRVNPGLKGLLCSGHLRAEEETINFGGGFNGFIRKPFNLNSLSRKIREILDRT